MAQFRVEFVLDPASGMYLAELYHPESENDVVVRTEPLYPTQAAAVLAVVQIFKEAMLQFPASEPPAKRKPKRKPKAGKAGKAGKAAKKKAAKKKSRKKG